jgi:hypothetical protein
MTVQTPDREPEYRSNQNRRNMAENTEDSLTETIELIDGRIIIQDLAPTGAVVRDEITPELIVENNDDSPLDIEFGWTFGDGSDEILKETVVETVGVDGPTLVKFPPFDATEFEPGTYEHGVVGGLADAGGSEPKDEFDAYFEQASVSPGGVATLVVEVPVPQEASAVDMAWKTTPEFADAELTSFTIGGDPTGPMLSLVAPDGTAVASQEGISSGMLVATFGLTVPDDGGSTYETESTLATVRDANDGEDVQYTFDGVSLSVDN